LKKDKKLLKVLFKELFKVFPEMILVHFKKVNKVKSDLLLKSYKKYFFSLQKCFTSTF
jgi:hypothetical protein